MSHLRTPRWREQTKSLTEQFETAWGAERLRYRDAASLRESLKGTEWETLSDAELEAMRDEFVADLEAGKAGVEMPVNNLIKLWSAASSGDEGVAPQKPPPRTLNAAGVSGEPGAPA